VGRLPVYPAAAGTNALPTVVIVIVVVIAVVITVAIAVPAAVAIGVVPAPVTIALIAIARLNHDALLDVRPRIDRDGRRRDDDRPWRRIRRRRIVVGVVDRMSDDAPADTERQADEGADRSDTMSNASHEPSWRGVAEARRSRRLNVQGEDQ
jgi:hypothetical protein